MIQTLAHGGKWGSNVIFFKCISSCSKSIYWIIPFSTDIKSFMSNFSIHRNVCVLVYTYVCVVLWCAHTHTHTRLFQTLFPPSLWNTMELGQKKPLTCPSSSKAMTTTAAPYFLILMAFSRKSASPSFRLMLLTMAFPWQHFSPASITAKLEESIHKGT